MNSHNDFAMLLGSNARAWERSWTGDGSPLIDLWKNTGGSHSKRNIAEANWLSS